MVGGSYVFHFPDGNASIARLLVRRLIPCSIPGSTACDIVGGRVDYARLDQPTNDVRIRLPNLCVRARNFGDPAATIDKGSCHKLQTVTISEAGLALGQV